MPKRYHVTLGKAKRPGGQLSLFSGAPAPSPKPKAAKAKQETHVRPHVRRSAQGTLFAVAPHTRLVAKREPFPDEKVAPPPEPEPPELEEDDEPVDPEEEERADAPSMTEPPEEAPTPEPLPSLTPEEEDELERQHLAYLDNLAGVDEPEPEEDGTPESTMVEMERFEVHANRPPNFFGCHLDRFRFIRGEKRYGRKVYPTFDPILPAPLPEDYDPAELSPMQWLEHVGFMDAVRASARSDSLADFKFMLGFFYSMTAKERGWDEMSDRMKPISAKLIRNLTAWWTNLNDAERQRFWDDFVNEDRPRARARFLGEPPG